VRCRVTHLYFRHVCPSFYVSAEAGSVLAAPREAFTCNRYLLRASSSLATLRQGADGFLRAFRCLDVVLGVDDLAVLVDDEVAAQDAHVLAPVHRLLPPHVVLLRHGVVRIDDELE